MPRSALHRRPPRRLPARLGPDGVPESAGHVPLEVPRHDNGILQPSGLCPFGFCDFIFIQNGPWFT
jgi:hypothetical protein